MTIKATGETAKTTTVDSTVEKKSRKALVGVKKGAAAAKRAAGKIAMTPAKLFDSAVYGACYGISYGTVFSALMITKMLPDNGLVIKGFHDGSKEAHKDFKIQQQKHVAEKVIPAKN